MTDWQKGDLALCVSRIPKAPVVGARLRDDDPRIGQILVVSRLGRDESWGLWIAFDDFEPHRYRSFRFRKVTPPKEDEFDREVIDLMNRKPVEA